MRKLVVFLLLLALSFAFVMTIKGDTSGGIHLDKTSVPRNCDIHVYGPDGTTVRVYDRSHRFTGLGCVIYGGSCSFKFTSSNPYGPYTVVGGGRSVEVSLSPKAKCVVSTGEEPTHDEVTTPDNDLSLQPIGSPLSPEVACSPERLIADPSYVETLAGWPVEIEVIGVCSNGAMLPREVEFSAEGGEVLEVDENKAYILFVKAGEHKVRFRYGDAEGEATVVVKPGLCSFVKRTDDVNVTAGESFTVAFRVVDRFDNPKNGVDVDLTYISPDGERVRKSAESSNGVVRATFEAGTLAGEGRVTAETGSLLCRNSASVKVEVLPGKIHSVEVSPHSLLMRVGDVEDLTAKVYDRYGNEIEGVEVEWSSEDESIATVEEGTVRAVYPGETTVRAEVTVMDIPGARPLKVRDEVRVKVENGAAESVVVDPSSVTLAVGESQSFSAHVYDEYGAPILFAPVEWELDGCGELTNGYYVAPTTPCVAHVYATYGDARGSAIVRVVPGEPYEIQIHAEDEYPVTANPKVGVRIVDEYGNDAKVDWRHYRLGAEVLQGDAEVVDVVTGDNPYILLSMPAHEDDVVLRVSLYEDRDDAHKGEVLTATKVIHVYLPGAKVRGYVTEMVFTCDSHEQVPLAGVSVTIDGTDYVATTDENGYFEMDDVNLDGEYTVRFMKVGYTEATRTVTIHRNWVVTTDAILARYGHVTVMVSDEQGLMLRDINVSLSDMRTSTRWDLTDRAGRVDFDDVAPGVYAIEAKGEGYDPVQVTVCVASGESEFVMITMSNYDVTPPAIAFLSPTPADGEAVSGEITILVSAMDENLDGLEVYANDTLLASVDAPTYVGSLNTEDYEDGLLTITAKAWDTHGNTAEIGRTFQIDNHPPTLSFLPPTPDENAVVDGPFVVNVSAEDETGVTSIVVSVNGDEVARCDTAPCQVEVDPRNYGETLEITANATSLLQESSITRHMFYMVPPEPARVDITATPSVIAPGNLSEIHVFVYDEEDEPVVAREVSLTASGGQLASETLVTDVNGHASTVFTANEEGEYIITVEVGGLTNTTTVRVRTPPQNALFTGTVSDEDGPLQGALVELYMGNLPVVQTQTGADGTFEVEVPAGRYMVKVSAPSHMPIHEAIDFEDGSIVSRDYVLEKRARLYGFVVDEDGNGIDDASVEIYRNGILMVQGQTGQDGSYEFYLDPGLYFVVAHKEGYRDGSGLAWLSDQDVRLDITLYR